MSGVTLERHEGALVAVKPSESHDRLQAEADTISRLQHPGVVELVSFETGPPATLRTVWVGTDNWDRQPPGDPRTIAAALAALATTLADIHDAGVCHGAVSPEHVIAGAHGRPVLCGFGDAVPGDVGAIRQDITGLRTIVDHLREHADHECRNDLQRLSDYLDDPKSGLRPFVQLIAEIPDRSSDPANRSTPPTRTLVAAGVAALAVILSVALANRSDDTRQIPGSPFSPGFTALSTPSSIAPPTSRPANEVTEPPVSTILGSTSAIEPTPPGQVLVHSGRRYGLGGPDDLVVLGDWDCDGEPTPAVLQRSTGLVAVFSTWPEPGRSIEPHFTHATVDTTSLTVERIDECDLLRARGTYGSEIIEPEDS